MQIHPFFDARTWTLTYLVWDETSRDAVVIDPVLDYDPIGVRVFEDSLNELMAMVKEKNLTIRGILETHAHADHLTSADRLRALTGAPVIIGSKITLVQETFAGVFNLEGEVPTDGSQFDRLLNDGEEIDLGTLHVRALATPGHTPACMSYVIEDAVFTGDALFMPDYGTGRCDFPRGSAADLYDSVKKLYTLPDATRVFVGHDYQPNGRAVAWQTTIGESKAANIQLNADTSRAQYIEFRTRRDKTLKLPTLLFQSLQVNMRAGQLPTEESNGKRYLKMPLNLFG